LIDGIQFVIYTIAPDLLPFSQTVVRYTRNEVTTRKFHACDHVMGNERADLAAASALSLPGMLTWLGIQHRTILYVCRHQNPPALVEHLGVIQFR